jgi:hypothetical protein
MGHAADTATGAAPSTSPADGPPELPHLAPASVDPAADAARLAGALMFPASFLHSVLETAVLAHFEVGQAAASLSSDTIVLVPKQGLNGWQQLLLALQGLAYAPEAVDPWHRLGITPHAGQPPSEATIEQRYAVAETLLAAADGPYWAYGDKGAATQALEQLVLARDACINLLPEVLRTRAKDPRNGVPPWAELGSEARGVMICSAAVPGELVATQLSDILGTAEDSECPDRVLRPEAARSLALRLAADGRSTLAAFEAQGIACWAPTDTSALGRLLAAYAQHAATVPQPCTLRLLVPLDSIPGSSTATDLLDLWNHPLLGDKWHAIVRNIQFTSQAMEVVLSGRVAPTSSPKVLLIATVSVTTPFAPPSIRSVAEPLFELGRGRCLRVDCLTNDIMPTRRVIGSVLSNLATRWADPTRSPGSTTTSPRTILSCHFAPGALTALEIRMLVSGLRNGHVPATTLLAAEDIFADNAAMLLELTDPAAALQVVALCEDMAFVSAKLMTVRTLAAPSVWEVRLEQMFAEAPSSCISRIRWRRSRHGGRVIAQPAATARQVQASVRAEQICPVAAASAIQAEISLHGNLGHDLRQVELHILRVLEAKGVVLHEISETAAATPGSWQSVAADMSAGPSGRLKLCLASPEHMAMVRSTLHDKAFQVGVDMITMAVHDDSTLVAQAKNGRRGARRRAGPPEAAATR